MEKLTYTHSFRGLLAYKLARELSLLLYEKHFISKLTDADGEQQETQHWIKTAVDYFIEQET